MTVDQEPLTLDFIIGLPDLDPRPQLAVVKGTLDGISDLMWSAGLARGTRNFGPLPSAIEESDYEARYYVARCRVAAISLSPDLLEVILECPATEHGFKTRDRLRRFVDQAEGARRMNPAIGLLAPTLFDIVCDGVGTHPDEMTEIIRTNRLASARDTLLNLDEFLVDGA